MAIINIDGVLAGNQPPQPFIKNVGPATNKLLSTWPYGGVPGAGSYNTTLNGGTYSSTGGLVQGQIPHTDPGGAAKSYLSRLAFMAQGSPTSTSGGLYILADRLWDNGGITITSTAAQTIVSPTWPARDANGATLGAGVLLAVEVSAATGAGTPLLTVSYTNSAGTSGRTGTNIIQTIASSPQGSCYLISLQGADSGVQSVQSLTLNASWSSGTINVVAFRPLAFGSSTSAGAAIDCITGGFPQLMNGVVPYLLVQPTQNLAAITLNGTDTETQH